jgi:hypothetical protein
VIAMSMLKTALLGALSWLVAAFLTFAVPVMLDSCSMGGEHRLPVAFTEFLADVDQGRVEEIHVVGRVATFRVRWDGKLVTRETIGPLEDREATLNLRPADRAAPAPRITVEP